MPIARIWPAELAVALRAIRVARRAGVRAQGWLTAGAARIPVALGRSGLRGDKREGDGATPRGRFRPLRVWWRPDRGVRPRTLLPVRRIRPGDGWCEDPADRRYNRPIRLADGQAGDRLWRTDHLYDLVIELDHNARPRVAGRGSAIFVHVARPGLQPTAGCVAMPPVCLRRLLGRIGPKTRIEIH
jgi:L,D-peptidoglycan transpeptidase YkuD (ErfK/YbiS/YcfS/YnhG family)